MNRWIWQLTRAIRQTARKVIKLVRGLTFNPTISTLKSIAYQDLPAPINWELPVDGRKLHIEIGSGHGEVLLANKPEQSLIVGYEIKSRFFRLSQRKTRRRDDIVVFKGNAYESLLLHYRNQSIDRIFILFPDPWHKKKHAKRRPLTRKFFARLAQKLKIGGEILVATDWPEYAEFVWKEADSVTELYSVTREPYAAEKFGLPITHYHQKWARKGRVFTAILLEKKG
jgi:tRNA (guanine-N7-)-methyltransferase